IFAINDGVPGYVNWWGDVRRLWSEMSNYVPRAGDQVGFLVSAGNARLVQGVTSVRERSNVVLVTLAASDVLNEVVGGTASGPTVPDGPTPAPVDLAPIVSKLAHLEELIIDVEKQNRLRYNDLVARLDDLKRAMAAHT